MADQPAPTDAAPASPAWTIHRLLDWTHQFFRQKGVESPRLDAEILLAHALACKRIELYVRSEEPADEAVRAQFRELVRRRAEGCPVAYLVGTREFYLLSFEVTPAVLIPRGETELVVMECLRLAKNVAEPRVLDIGTGSGNVAVSIAQQAKTARVTAVDRSAEALAVAARNAAKHGVVERVAFREGDLFGPLPPGESFHFIVSNPPYIASAEVGRLQPDVRDFEPHLALDGGPDGLAVLDRLIAGAAAFLLRGGHLIVEVGIGQAEAVGERFAAAGFGPVRTLPDRARIPRVLAAQRPA